MFFIWKLKSILRNILHKILLLTSKYVATPKKPETVDFAKK